MLYMIDRRPVMISALCLSIHSVFVDVLFHVHSAKHHSLFRMFVLVVFFIIMILSSGLFNFVSIVSRSINSPSLC